MNIRDQKKAFYLSVKKLVGIWEAGGLKALGPVFDDERTIIEKDSWVSKVKELFIEKKYISLNAEIALVSRTFKYKDYDDEEKEGRGRDSRRPIGDKDQEIQQTYSIPGGTRATRDQSDRHDTNSDGRSNDNRPSRGTPPPDPK